MTSASWRVGPAARLALVLDGLILVQLLMLGIVFAGGVDFGWLSVHRSAKPLLILMLAAAVRLAVPVSPPYLQAVRSKPWFQPVLTLANRVHVAPSVADALSVVLVTRLATVALAFLSNVLLPDRQFRPFSLPFRAEKFAEIFAAWDSGWYFDIAQRGYYFRPDGQSSVAFFPLYPLLMRLVATPFGGSDRAIWVAGMAISATAFVAALVALHRFAEQRLGDREAARRTILYVAVFPFSLFFMRVYTESLFFLFSVLAIASASNGRWWRAGLAGALGALTRSNGILVAIPLLCFAVADVPRVRVLAQRLAALTLVPLGLGVYCAYMYRLTGDPLAWLDAQRHWYYSVGDMPWRRLLTLISMIERHGIYDFVFTSALAPYQLIHGTVALAVLALIPAVFARLGVGLGAYVLVSLMVPLTGSDLQGIGRYMAVVFPIFMLLGSVRSPRVHEAILVVFSLFLALFVGLFVNWYPIY
ncbi:MAG: mannosyltransferase family protein [Vicinamibacterales bacterium]